MLACTQLHSPHAITALWYHAATCFEAAKEIPRASKAFSEGKFYDKAVLVFFEAQDMPGCLQAINSFSQYIDPALLRRIKEVVTVHFLRQQDYRQLKQLYSQDLNECIELARSLGFKAQAKDLLRIAQRFDDLAAEHLSDGLPAEAVSCLVHCVKSPSAILQSRAIISVFLWANFGLKDIPGGRASEQATLLLKLCNFQDDLLDREGVEDVKVFEAIASRKRISLDIFYDLLGCLNQESEAYHSRVAVLQYHLLKGNRWVTYSSHEAFSAHLGIWSAYNTHFQRVHALKYPSRDPGVCRLLGLSRPSSTGTSEITIPSGSPLYKAINKPYAGRSGGKTTQSSITIHSSRANMYIQTMFANQVKREFATLSLDLLGSHRTKITPTISTNIPSESGTSFENAMKSIFLVLQALDSVADREDGVASVLTEGDEEKIWISWSMRLFSTVFSSSGSVGELGNVLSSGNSDAAVVYAWVSKTLQFLESPEHSHTFVTLLVVCVALIFEMQSTGVHFATIPPLEIQRHTRLLRGCPKEPDRFMDDIVTFFQRDAPWRIINMNKTLRRMVRNSWIIDISVLVQLIEQTARGAILAERATASWSYGGFSGLIVPRSWATNLVMHSTHAGHSYALNAGSLGEFVGHILEILLLISNGIPEHLNVSVVRNGAHKCHPGVIAARLIWSIMFVMVNLHPTHKAVPSVLDALNQAVAHLINFQGSFAEGFQALGFPLSCLPKKIDQQSCLPVLLKTYLHEDVIILQGRGASVHPRSSLFATREIVKFDSLAHLRNLLARSPQRYSGCRVAERSSKSVNAARSCNINLETKGMATTSMPALSVEHVDFQLDESEVIPMTPSSRPDTPISLSDSEGTSLDDWDTQPKLSLQVAALHIFRAWKRSVRREEQRRRLSDFDQEGQLYEQYRQYFPRVGTKSPKRDILGLKLIRGPCINIVLGLRLLAEEIDVYSEALKNDIHAPGLTPAQLASTQESIKQRKKKADDYKDTVLACCPLDSPPKLLIAKNLAGVKTQTKHAWDAFMLVKNSGILHKSEQFGDIEDMVSSGRDVVLDSTNPLR
ncbi:unnamed protein product [Rhizoctonia solani]|uniref:Uncharacterized protein n=5 Tax=Rhizoctonia solani TaxID=456999 RepID=A0A8H3HTQ3_9AGAM|nr:unnamed protein product [Rhizoctonia solani]CAE6539329.1 unnamed protein product [Rhizoctonia solani]